MPEQSKSYNQILRSTLVVGGASALNILIGLLKVKVLALLLGPSGVGLVGLFTSILTTSSTLAGCGLSNSGVRQLAAAGDDVEVLSITRRTLWYANFVLGLLGMILLLMLRKLVAKWVFGSTTYADEVGWLGLGVLLTLVASSQTTLLQGLRRIREFVFVSVLGMLASTFAGIAAVYWFGESGVLWFILAAPAASIGIGVYFTAKLPSSKHESFKWSVFVKQLQTMLSFGLVFMTTGLMTSLTQLAVRSLVSRDMGLDTSGQFHAAWSISMTYIGFVLNAMGTDYYPRLTNIIEDHKLVNNLVNKQTEVSLLLAGPFFLGMLTFSPFIISVLYSTKFSMAAEVLRWQVLGDILKVATFPMSFVLIAGGIGSKYFLTELIWNITYLAIIYLGLPYLGLNSTGIAFFISYCIYFLCTYYFVHCSNDFYWSSFNFKLGFCLLISGCILFVFTSRFPFTGKLLGILMTLALTYFSLRTLTEQDSIANSMKNLIKKLKG